MKNTNVVVSDLLYFFWAAAACGESFEPADG
jgi:hypothetical protein